MRISKAPNRRCEIAHRSQALLDGRFDADWLVHGRSRLNEIVLFEDAMVAVARQDHWDAEGSYGEGVEFVGVRCSAPALNFVLEVSELLEVLVIASQSHLVGLVPRSMLRLALAIPFSFAHCP
jgi:hypothetical protein